MTTAASVLNVARSQVGYVEGPNNHTKYGVAYGLDHAPWCAMFVWWVARQASGGDKLIAPIAYTPALAQWFREQGDARWGIKPRIGAIALFDFPDSVHRIQHVGIVEKVLPNGYIQTIEGNTSSGTAGSQSDGGGVYRRIRRTSLVVMYGYPAYTTPAAVRPAPAPARGTTRHLPPLVVDGVMGAKTIAQTQRYLHLPVTTRWDGDTRRGLQRWLRVPQDGVIGRVTTRAWRAKVGAPTGTGIDRTLIRAHQRYLNRNL